MFQFFRSQGLGEPCANRSDEGAEITEETEGSTERMLSGVEGDQYLELPEFLTISLSNLEPFVTMQYAGTSVGVSVIKS